MSCNELPEPTRLFPCTQTMAEVMREEADNLPYDAADRILSAVLPHVVSFFAGMCTTGLILFFSLKGAL